MSTSSRGDKYARWPTSTPTMKSLYKEHGMVGSEEGGGWLKVADSRGAHGGGWELLSQEKARGRILGTQTKDGKIGP